ncbi:MAG: citrate/2-methylcitrate synthase [Spirochaetia bacterium]
MKKKNFFEAYTPYIEKKSKIPTWLYEKYNVKRGLRNIDGTGVLVGLTEIGEVHGYILDEGEKVPRKGRLLYRGININEIVDGFQRDRRFGFEETTYLLLFSELPTKQYLIEYAQALGEKRSLPDNFTEDMILKAPSPNIMNKLARAVLALYSYDEDPEALTIRNILRQSVEIIARFPILVAYAYQAKRHYYEGDSLFLHAPDPDLSTAENFLQMIRPDKKYTALEAEMLDLAFVLHAEHGGGNNSAFSIHVVSSSNTDTYSAIAAAIGSLKGGKHGGANIKVMEMMEDIKENVSDWANEDEVRDYLKKILKKKAFDKSGLIYGLGHAVYTLSDPRAVLMKQKAATLARAAGSENEYNLYTIIERVAPDVFREVKKTDKPICVNVDFYSGFVYRMLNIPKELYTPLFAIARVSSWCAHRIEELVSGGKIIRPAYKSVKSRRPYVELGKRTGEE